MTNLVKRYGTYEAVAALWQKVKIVSDNSPPPTNADYEKLAPYLEEEQQSVMTNTLRHMAPSPFTLHATLQFNGYAEYDWYKLCKGIQGRVYLNIETGYLLHSDGNKQYTWIVDFDNEILTFERNGEVKRRIKFAKLALDMFNGNDDAM